MDTRQHPFHLRYRQSRVFPRDGSASSEMAAPVEVVWEVLIDFERYPDWNVFTPRVETSLRVGSPVRLQVDMPGRSRRTRTEWINLVEPHRTICWGLHIGHPGLLCANRWQELHELEDGRTRYVTTEGFSGLLAPLVMALYAQAMRQGFQSVADGLKERAPQCLDMPGHANVIQGL